MQAFLGRVLLWVPGLAGQLTASAILQSLGELLAVEKWLGFPTVPDLFAIQLSEWHKDDNWLEMQPR